MTSMTDSRKIRNDGKVRCQPVLGLLPTTHNALVADPQKAAPSWHELVQPGSKGDRATSLARRADRGQATPNTGVVVKDMSSAWPRSSRREAHGRSWTPGRLILHTRSAFRPAADEDTQPRTSVLARRLRRASV